MSAENIATPKWESLRTEESRRVEDLLQKHFQQANAYRYNSASLRVRVIDERFRGLSQEQRDEIVEPFLDQLPEETQADIVNLVLLYPREEDESTRAHLNNLEFDEHTDSML